MQSEVGLADVAEAREPAGGREPAGRPWWRRPVVWMAAGALVIVGAGGAAAMAVRSGGQGDVTSVSGSVTIEGPSNVGVFRFTENPRSCSGEGKFAGVAKGAGVTVRDGEGDVLGRGRLGHGEPLDISDAGFGDIHIADRCLFMFTVHNVPERGRYTVEVAGHGRITVTKEQVESKDVALRLTG